MVFMKNRFITEILIIIGIVIVGGQIGIYAASENGDMVKILHSNSSGGTRLDLAILFDDTGSLDKEITALKKKVHDLTNNITLSQIDCRYALISFKDTATIQQGWTSDPVVIKRAVDALEAIGGDDAPEADLDAIETALSLGFRPDAYHMILDITDERTHYRGDGTAFSQYTIQDTINDLINNSISYILVGPVSVTDPFNPQNDKKEIVYALGENGLFIDIDSDNFSDILDTLMGIITTTYTTENATLNQNGVRIPGVQMRHEDGETDQNGNLSSSEAVFSSFNTSDTIDKDLGNPAQEESDTRNGESSAPISNSTVEVTISGKNYDQDANIRLNNMSSDLLNQDSGLAIDCEGWEVTSGYYLDTKAGDSDHQTERISRPWCWCNGYPYNKNSDTCIRPQS